MEFKFRAIDEQASTYPPPTSTSSRSFFSEQAFRAGYSGPDFGRTSGFFQTPSSMLAMQRQREFEKEKIREEIIASEVARRQMLEAEVRREMFLEREMALVRAEGSSLFSGAFSGASAATPQFGPRMPLLHQSEGESFERLAFSFEERLGNRTRGGIGGFQTLPFQQNSEPRISEVKPPSEVNKDRVIFLAKPEGNLSGEKRKAVTPPAAGPNPVSLKKPKEEWSCAICQVTATSERGLNEHLQGKKHKSREAGLRALRTGKNYAIGLFPKNTRKPIKLAEITENQDSEQEEKLEVESVQVDKSVDVWLQKKPIAEDEEKNKDLAPQVSQDTGKSRKKRWSWSQKIAQKIQKTEDQKKMFKFWCEMCQVHAFSEKVMDSHKKGKKHMGVLQELNRKGGSAPFARWEEAPRTGKESEVVAKDEKCQVGAFSEKVMDAHKKGKKHMGVRQELNRKGGSAASAPFARREETPRTGKESEVVAKDEKEVTPAFVKEPEVVAKHEKELTPQNVAGAAGGEEVQNHGASDDEVSSGPI